MDHRNERVTEAIREELAELIEYEMADPRVANIVVTAVFVSPDKKRAVVRVGVRGNGDPDAAVACLEHGKSFLKRQLSQRLNLFRLPELYFEADRAVMPGERLNALFKRIRKGRPRGEDGPPEKKAVE